MMPMVKTGCFYLAVVLIVVVAVFPFYYAIITSFKTGTALFEVNYWPTAVQPRATTSTCFSQGEFPRNILNSVLRRHADGRLRAAARRSPPPTRWRGCGSAGGRSCS